MRVPMLRYLMTAGALKVFSATPQTKSLYRYLGNRYGARRRVNAGLPKHYIHRPRYLIERVRTHHAIQPGDRLLELGTGWMPWESTILRLLYDVEITLFDTWDNRQFSAMHQYFKEFGPLIDDVIPLDPEEKHRVESMLAAIAAATSYEEVYRLLGFTYVVNPAGSLDSFPENSFNLAYSFTVMEHVCRAGLPAFIHSLHRLLKPGGLSIHLIDLGDHLAYYDTGVSYKNYLRYSDRQWKALFQNDVQYFNRVQRPEWMQMFQSAGFSLVEQVAEPTDIAGLHVDAAYAHLSHEDRSCMTLKIVHRKPA
jgi:predicted SAM-dependent methyltransferase